jgi:hypothetical protein
MEALAEITGGSRHWLGLYDTATSFGKQDETALDMMYRLAATVVAAPREAFHLTMTSFMRESLSWLVDTVYHTVVVSFLRDYWRWAVKDYAIHFSAPPRTLREFEEALVTPGLRGLRLGLRLIGERIGVVLSEKYKESLSDKID